MPIQEGDFIRLSFSGYANGVLFDTTDEQKARDAGIYDENRTYGPKMSVLESVKSYKV
jgi:FKBP-type peptidyl-prolyl cis-trans isomerase 2